MLRKVLLLIFAIVLPFATLSCGSGKHAPSATHAAQSDILTHLRRPGKVTHVRYTSYTPPWPTRTEAWIDWDSNRIRAWNIEWTDSPENPSICTSIRNGADWYFCLPSLERLDASESSLLSYLSPDIPLRASDSALSLAIPSQGSSTPAAATPAAQHVLLGSKGAMTRETQGGMDVLVTSWKIASQLDSHCPQGQQAGSSNFEYTSTTDGVPLSEFITVTCGGQPERYFGVIYHDIQYIDPSDLPADFFDATSARTSIIANELSSAAAQIGSVFWFGDEADGWTLAGAEHDAHSARITYSRGSGEQAEDLELTTRSVIGYSCPNAEPISADAYGGSLCTLDIGEGYRIVWKPPGFDAFLEERSYPPRITRDEILALGAKLRPWDKKATEPLLTQDDVRNLVADSLELVCPTNLAAIRNAAPSSAFTFDRKTGEWTGVFGSFGEYAVPDAKPVAIPTKNRSDVESTLSHNAAQFANCTVDEQPSPQAGDDTFGVTFISEDASGFTFQVTGVDAKAEAAISMCLTFAGGGCGLTAPDGTRITSAAIELNGIRPQVYAVRAGLSADRLKQTGQWTFAIDLGDGRTAQTTFDVQ